MQFTLEVRGNFNNSGEKAVRQQLRDAGAMVYLVAELVHNKTYANPRAGISLYSDSFFEGPKEIKLRARPKAKA